MVTGISERGTMLAVTTNRTNQRRNNCLHSVLRFLVTANVPSSPILVKLMIQAIHPSETSVLTRVTRLNIPEHGILHNRSCGNLESYIALPGWTL
jgi:hypothetical protein